MCFLPAYACACSGPREQWLHTPFILIHRARGARDCHSCVKSRRTYAERNYANIHADRLISGMHFMRANVGSGNTFLKWVVAGVCSAMMQIASAGYRLLFLTARPITRSEATRKYLSAIGLVSHVLLHSFLRYDLSSSCHIPIASSLPKYGRQPPTISLHLHLHAPLIFL
jgi:hypothetical protein